MYADEQLAVCIKPVGVLSQSDGTQEGMEALLAKALSGSIYAVHRLDQPVSGVMVYARTKQAAAALSGQMQADDFAKTYLCLCEGSLEPCGEMTDLLFKDSRSGKTYPVKRERKGVREARLRYEILAADGAVSLCRVHLITGRSHQIRAQFAARRHPLLGDGKYGSKRNCPLALYSYQLCFLHPISRKKLCFTAPLPQTAPWQQYAQFLQSLDNFGIAQNPNEG